jgi:hypothetical protein
LILRLYPDESKEILGAMESIIQEFHEIDPIGQEFRYAKRTDQKPSLTNLPNEFSLDDLLLTMAKVEVYFDGIVSVLDAKIDGLIE